MEIKVTIIWTALIYTEYQMYSLAIKSDRKTLTHINLKVINICMDTTKQFIKHTKRVSLHI